jgi:hypothetical protein
VISSNGAGTGAVDDMNHVELRISQDKIEVWATDAGVAPTPQTLRLIAEITDANLTFTRGLIWLEDVHYNADKGPMDRPSQREHTFAWDNVAFDGPFTYRDFSYDALDNNAPAANGARNLAKFAEANQTTTWNVLNLPANRQATTARVLFNLTSQEHSSSVNLTVNGHAHPTTLPFPAEMSFWKPMAVAIPMSELATGTNVVTLGADAAAAFANVNIVLADVPNGVPVLPGAPREYPN